MKLLFALYYALPGLIPQEVATRPSRPVVRMHLEF
jgi:hypothetical protein